MKDYVEMDHLTKFEAFMWKRDQGINIKTRVKNSYKWLRFLDNVPQNHINSQSSFYEQTVIFLLAVFQIVSEWPDFTVVTELQNDFIEEFWNSPSSLCKLKWPTMLH